MASAAEIEPAIQPVVVVQAEGCEEGVAPQEIQVAVAQPVNPQATPRDGVPVVTAQPVHGLARTASAVLMARPVVVTRNNVPLLTCRCPKADDLPDCCGEECALKLCAIPMYLFFGGLVIFASFATTKLAMSLGIWDPAAWKTCLLTFALMILIACCCAGCVKVMDGNEDVYASCAAGNTALALLAALLCYAVSAPLTENWHMFNGAPAVRFVDPELAAGELTEFTAKDVALLASSFNGRLTASGTSRSNAIIDAPTDVDPSHAINVQDEYSEIEFALSSYIDTSLSVPIYFDDDDVSELDKSVDGYAGEGVVPQLCVAPVLRTCGVLPGGAPWGDIHGGTDGHLLLRTGVAPLNASNLPSVNPSINQPYCDSRRYGPFFSPHLL